MPYSQADIIVTHMLFIGICHYQHGPGVLSSEGEPGPLLTNHCMSATGHQIKFKLLHSPLSASFPAYSHE